MITEAQIVRNANALKAALLAQAQSVKDIAELEKEKAEAFIRLQTDYPDLKFGRSNLERDAVIFTYYPDLGDQIETAQEVLAASELDVALAKVDVSTDRLLVGLVSVLGEE